MNIEVTDKELFEIIGRKEVEIFNNEKVLEAYRLQFEKLKPVLTEAEAAKTAKAALEESNKSLAETNINLDRAVTGARKERDVLRTNLTAISNQLQETQEKHNARVDELGAANKRYLDLQHTCDDMQKEIDAFKASKPAGKGKR